MLCLSCNSKPICKHFQAFQDAQSHVSLEIKSCALYNGSEIIHESVAEEHVAPIKKEPSVFPSSLDRAARDYRDFNQNKKADIPQDMVLNYMKKYDGLQIEESEQEVGICDYCGKETEVFKCKCGKLCCDDCGTMPYCKDCWEA